MSTQINQYIMFGITIPFEKYEDGSKQYERYEDYMDDSHDDTINHYNGLCVISDGMNGEYFFIGKVLMKSKVYEFIDGPIDLESLECDREMLAGLITATFDDLNVSKEDIKLWFFTHYR